MKSINSLLLVLLLLPFIALQAQHELDCTTVGSSSNYSVCDDFSYSTLTDNPIWVGQVDKFTINDNQQLQLNNTGVDTAYIATANTQLAFDWQLYYKLGFDPSSNNHLRIYLAADKLDLTAPLNGYFLKIGQSGSEDAIEFYQQIGSDISLLTSGQLGLVSDNPEHYLRITRSETGTWSVFTATNEEPTFTVDFTTIATDITTTQYFGFWCKHTMNNSTKFFFDNVYIGLPIEDTSLPTLTNFNVLNNKELQLLFSESIASATLDNSNNYTLNNMTNPSNIEIVNEAATIITISFPESFLTNQENSLKISQLTDLADNVLQDTIINFFYYETQANDIIFTEILADPTPSVGLPNVEFVELYNPTNFPISLKNWSLTKTYPDLTTTFPDTILAPKEYLLVCKSGNSVDSLQHFGKVIGLSNFPVLNNDGATLTLVNEQGIIIDEVSYATSWYQDTAKDDGGWTLELINPMDTCGMATNWIASTHPSGGTPAQENSVFNEMADTTAPMVTTVEIITENALGVFLSEPVTLNTLLAVENYYFDNGLAIGNVTVMEEGNGVQLFLLEELVSGIPYTLHIENLSDCLGNILDSQSITIGVPNEAAMYDVVINEIYADTSIKEEFFNVLLDLPKAPFIELYNRSDKYLNLGNWLLIDNTDTTTISSYTLAPNEYVVLADVDDMVLFEEKGLTVVGVSNFPTLNVGGDEVILVNALGAIIHAVQYDKSWYQDVIKQEGGWTLEMIDPNNPCTGANNWRASNHVIGGTPLQENSIFAANPDTNFVDLLRVEAIDELTIRAYFSEPIATVKALDLANYNIDNIGQPIQAIPEAPYFRTVVLSLPTPLSINTIYTFTVKGLTDCVGNEIGVFNTAKLGLTTVAEKGDLIFNEILFNPSSDGSDFVEIYNRSTKVIDLSKWLLTKINVADNTKIDLTAINLAPYSIFPNQLLVLTPDVENIITTYGKCHMVDNRNFISVNFDNYPNEEGILTLTNAAQTITLDSLAYTSNWHHPLLNNEEGVSLERIDYEAATQDGNNWHSAATTACFATPSLPNSQVITTHNLSENFGIAPTTFSPDFDGFQDYTTINYHLEEAGFVANITIYDAGGRLVKRLVTNALLGERGVFQWNGLDEENQKVGIGIYVINFEVFDLAGDKIHWRRTCVVAGKL